ncbi:MAG: hypothetical protein R3C59_12125 [Planctomycetaceae bacterium]
MSAVPASSVLSTSSVVIDDLRRQLLRSQITRTDRRVVSTGFERLDGLLPEQGLPSGAVIEWVSDSEGLRGASIALCCAAACLKDPGALAIVDTLHCVHVPALSHRGIPLSRLLLVRPGRSPQSGQVSEAELSQAQRSDALWSLEQLARCSGVRVVLAWVDRLSSTAQRRLQLAVENSGVTVFLMRPQTALRQTSWADLRFHVQSVPRPVTADGRGPQTVNTVSHIAVRLVRCRNRVQPQGQILLDYNHETGAVSETSELAGSATTAAAVG